MPNIKARCPVCLSDATDHFSDHLHACRSCGIAFNSKFKPKLYDGDYFLGEYRKQYGKTYLEDYDAIYAASKRRLTHILKLIDKKKNPEKLSLLDIGSAAGFFLKCASDAGIQRIAGIEISEYAAAYCAETFHLPVIRAAFDDLDLHEKYDIITAWFFIEHCQDPMAVIDKIYSALNPGGIFAFSAPSLFGPLFKFNLAAWIDTHPTDHRLDFSPSSARKILKNKGFKKTRVLSAAFHPERVMAADSMLYGSFSVAYKLYSRLTAFSDTIEVYAKK